MSPVPPIGDVSQPWLVTITTVLLGGGAVKYLTERRKSKKDAKDYAIQMLDRMEDRELRLQERLDQMDMKNTDSVNKLNLEIGRLQGQLISVTNANALLITEKATLTAEKLQLAHDLEAALVEINRLKALIPSPNG